MTQEKIQINDVFCRKDGTEVTVTALALEAGTGRHMVVYKEGAHLFVRRKNWFVDKFEFVRNTHPVLASLGLSGATVAGPDIPARPVLGEELAADIRYTVDLEDGWGAPFAAGAQWMWDQVFDPVVHPKLELSSRAPVVMPEELKSLPVHGLPALTQREKLKQNLGALPKDPVEAGDDQDDDQDEVETDGKPAEGLPEIMARHSEVFRHLMRNLVKDINYMPSLPHYRSLTLGTRIETTTHVSAGGINKVVVTEAIITADCSF